jgi:hypothetical protein
VGKIGRQDSTLYKQEINPRCDYCKTGLVGPVLVHYKKRSFLSAFFVSPFPLYFTFDGIALKSSWTGVSL